MLLRQKVILTLLREVGGKASRLSLMKWAFLLAQESVLRGNQTYYRFVPYLYGPFSFALQQELSKLQQAHIIASSPDNKSWLLQHFPEDDCRLPAAVKKDITRILETYRVFSPPKLLEKVYQKYPWFTMNSKDENQRRVDRPQAAIAIYTIGYEQLSIDDFLNRVLRNGIRQIIDVRYNPVARRYGFHKSTLARLCKLLAIEYIHLPELGIPGEQREHVVTMADYKTLFQHYRASILPHQSTAMAMAVRAITSIPSALLCMEADPARCHRSHLAEVLAQQTGLPVVHLEWPR